MSDVRTTVFTGEGNSAKIMLIVMADATGIPENGRSKVFLSIDNGRSCRELYVKSHCTTRGGHIVTLVVPYDGELYDMDYTHEGDAVSFTLNDGGVATRHSLKKAPGYKLAPDMRPQSLTDGHMQEIRNRLRGSRG